MKRRWFLLGGAPVFMSAKAQRPPATARVGATAPDFSAPDTAGRARSLAEFKGRPVVMEWSSTSCPFAAVQYASGRMPELQRWARERGVAWLTVLSSHPSRTDYLPGRQAEAFNRERGGSPTALLIDGSGMMGRTYGAVVANHMFVIGASGRLVYAGGIDDSQSMEIAAIKRSHNHVRAALEDALSGRSVKTAVTQPFGCGLAYEG